MPDPVVEAIRSRKISAVRAAIQSHPDGARHPRAICAAVQAAFLPTIELLVRNGADLNGSYRNYRPLHALLQEDPHAAAGKPSAERLACLDWILDHGADAEQLGAWPSARALIIAAFVGEPEYVKRLRKAGAKVDGFTGAALGDRKAVEKALKQPDFALARDHGLLTALQCAAGSRLPRIDTLSIARLLLDAGADPNARTKSWSEEVTAAYFAAGTKSAEMFTLLLDRGADATDAVGHAVWGKHFDLAEIALEHGAALDRATANGKPLLNDLIRWGQIPQMMWMIEHGASPNVADSEGWTATHQAASRGNARMMRAVLDNGGDLKRRCHKGFTPVQFAVLAKRESLLPMLTA